MKTAILCGGLGTRLSEETEFRPKPMIVIGHRPILWHVMKGYATYGLNEFVLCLGYKSEVVKDYFLNYRQRTGNVTVDLGTGRATTHAGCCEDWTVHLYETGRTTQTGGRLKRVASLLGDETFMLTYGDGVANVDITELLAFHRRHGRLATVTGVRPPARFGSLGFNGDRIVSFAEKPQMGEGWINGGFFVFEPGVLDYIDGDETVLEQRPLERLAADEQLLAYRHEGFWQCMDTLRDVRYLERLWQTDQAPWKVW